MEHPRLRYQEETSALQALALGCGLVEKIKWGKPCFMFKNKNIVLIQGFNDYVALMFFKGSLLKDQKEILHRIGEHMRGPEQLRFTSVAEIVRKKATIKAYIQEAIDVEESGAKLERKPVTALQVPEELQSKLNANPALKRAFADLTAGRQKGYIYQIANAKQAATRVARVERFTPRILAGRGLLD